MTIIGICHVHDISWDLDFDPPHSCEYEDEYDLLVFEEQELPFTQETPTAIPSDLTT